MTRYFLPRSLSWWTGVAAIIAGLFLAAEPVHGLTALAETIRNATNMTAPVMITYGMSVIGLRRAISGEAR